MSTTIETEIYSYDDDIINQENIEEYSSMYNVNALSTDEDDIGRLATIKTFSDYFHETLSSYNGLTGDDDFDFANNDVFDCESALNTMLKPYNGESSNKIVTYKNLLDLYGEMIVISRFDYVDEFGNVFGVSKRVRTTFFEKAPDINDSELNRAVKLDTSINNVILGRKQFEDYIIYNEITEDTGEAWYGCLIDVFMPEMSE